LNVFGATTQSWGSWSFAGGVVQGVPTIAATDGTAYFAARDNFNAYWINSYTPPTNIGTWTNLGGVFATDPVMAAAPGGTIYFVGKDNFDALWVGRFLPPSTFLGWTLIGGVVQGQPSVTAGADSAAYIGVRDIFDAVWMARVDSSGTLTGWFFGGGVVSTDPRVAASGGTVYSTVLDPGGGVWCRPFLEGTGDGWQSWVFSGGVLQDASPAASTGSLFIAGRDLSNQLWWYSASGDQWTFVGFQGLAAGPLAAAPR
jgi:hypothetical protein